MSMLDRLERKFGRYYIPNLTIVLVFGQAVFYVLTLMNSIRRDDALLVPALVVRGEVWRLLTFVFVPAVQTPIFFAFALYLFYLMGTALESYWGEFRYNVYLLIGFLATVAVSFLTPDQAAGVGLLGGSVFLAFAWLNPDFELLLFFILPVRIKWLALLTWIGYGYGLLAGDWGDRFRILAAIGNFLVFFWPELVARFHRGGRQMAWRAKKSSARRGEEVLPSLRHVRHHQ